MWEVWEVGSNWEENPSDEQLFWGNQQKMNLNLNSSNLDCVGVLGRLNGTLAS